VNARPVQGLIDCNVLPNKTIQCQQWLIGCRQASWHLLTAYHELKMKIGLLFGSFNPIHIGHLIIANYMANYTTLDKVWLVVSPQNPLKKYGDLINTYDRLEMAKLATDNSTRIAVSDVELRLPQPSYTIDTLTHLKEKYPEHEFAIIMGSDNLTTLHKWKNYKLILRDYRIYVYPRPGYENAEFASHPSVTITMTPLMELSATFIRKSLSEKKNVQYFVPDPVLEFIESKNLYRHG
jgi:nicotinate-nucleotide adenylyltransferase